MDEAQTVEPKEGAEHEGPKGDVQFGAGGNIALGGIIGGVALALGFSWILLAYGQVLGTTVVTILLAGALVVGGGVAVISAFFGLVMPRVVRGHWRGRWPQHFGKGPGWRGCGDWKGEDYSDYADFGIWAEPDYQNWTLQDWKAWGEKMKAKFRK